ncbi:LADA_0G11606g1_1 [Lachancea dasiensis]|uniref:LADA_0G11606g1_1 n=1 Tax=Lachancea dasiensis TaxID=1072105 RepID=A0A1G4JV34_9SACH|nr:LADA_0G11606g1_1 [Lachancea dasiensis]
MFLSFYITSLKHSLVFQHLLSYESPSFKALWTKVQVVAPESKNEEMWCKADLGKNLQVYKVLSKSSDLIFWCLVTRQPNPLEPMVFLETFENTLLNYFDKDRLTIAKVINNQDRIALLLNCMVDANEPAILDLNKLKEMVPNREDLAKVLNSTATTLSHRMQIREPSHTKGFGITSTSSPAMKSADLQAVPWRTAALKYSNNELYVDVIEKIHFVLHKNLKTGRLHTVRGILEGSIDFRSQLTGDPVVALSLNLAGHNLGIPALHSCCQAHKEHQRIDELQFIPPDGKFQLMKYTVDLENAAAGGKSQTNMGLVAVDYEVGLGSVGDEFEIRVNIASSQHTKHIDDLIITVNFNAPSLVSSVCKLKVLRNTHGHFENSVDIATGRWILDQHMSTGTLPVLRGCLEHASPEQIKSLNLAVSFSNKGELPSGIKVSSVDIISGMPRNLKPFKGVKYIAKTGDFHLR